MPGNAYGRHRPPIDEPRGTAIAIGHCRSSGRRRTGNAVTPQGIIGGCPRSCKRRADIHDATRPKGPGRRMKASTRKPEDLPATASSIRWPGCACGTDFRAVTRQFRASSTPGVPSSCLHSVPAGVQACCLPPFSSHARFQHRHSRRACCRTRWLPPTGSKCRCPR